MSDGVLLTRLFVFFVLGWPVIAVSLVYGIWRSSIPRVGVFFAKCLGLSYGISLLGPLAMMVVFWLVGLVPEIATFYTIFLGVPIFATSPVVVALLVARRA